MVFSDYLSIFFDGSLIEEPPEISTAHRELPEELEVGVTELKPRDF
jgi:hypothetical protein